MLGECNKCRVMWVFSCLIVAVCSLAFPKGAQAQCVGQPGNNAVLRMCSNGAFGPTGSTALIDASVFSGTDICAKIYNALQSAPTAGAIIDARGINPFNTPCASGTSPWYNGVSGYIDKPSYLLLPTGTITISYTWVLPDKTRVAGQGASTTGQTGTVLSALSPFMGATSGYPVAMVQFGDPSCMDGNSGVCFDISMEDVSLNGNSVSGLGGILNFNAQELTYAIHINFYQVAGTGLQIDSVSLPYQGQNSGPYIDISYSGGSTGTCASITGYEIRGIHGISCTATGNNGAAILLDAAATTLEDVNVSGFGYGIVLGSQKNTVTGKGDTRALGDTLLNISGTVTNDLIRICNPSVTSNPCPGGSTGLSPVWDVTVLAATSGSGTKNTIQDDMASSTLPNSTDAHVAMYMLGEYKNGGFSRFTSSKSYPTWLVGSGNIPTNTGCAANLTGSLYSSTASSGSALWVCVAGSWQVVK